MKPDLPLKALTPDPFPVIGHIPLLSVHCPLPGPFNPPASPEAPAPNTCLPVASLLSFLYLPEHHIFSSFSRPGSLTSSFPVPYENKPMANTVIFRPKSVKNGPKTVTKRRETVKNTPALVTIFLQYSHRTSDFLISPVFSADFR
jgi:hypothetical protein